MENNLNMICSLIMDIDKETSNVVLQKYLYFIQAYFLATKDKPIFQDEIESWMYGPVVPNAYYKYEKDRNIFSKISYKDLSEETIDVIKTIVLNLKKFSTKELIYLTYSYEPWIKSWEQYGDKTIPKESIKNYHKNKFGMF